MAGTRLHHLRGRGGPPLPPSAPMHDEKPEEKKVEPVEIVEEDNPLILSNGWYLSQVPKTKPQLAKAFKSLAYLTTIVGAEKDLYKNVTNGLSNLKKKKTRASKE